MTIASRDPRPSGRLSTPSPVRRTFSTLAVAVATLVPGLTALACSSTAEAPVGSSEGAVNYRATTGQEYALEADIRFVLTGEEQTAAQESFDKRDAVVKAAAQSRMDAITSAVNSELTKRWPEDLRTKRQGSVALMVRQTPPNFGSLHEADDGGTFAFTYSLEFGAQFDFDAKLATKESGGKRFLSLDVPALTNTGNSETDGHVDLEVKKVERSRNAYPKYDDLFADGLDIYFQMGGDYNDSRGDLRHAKYLYEELVATGFTSPVAKYDDLKLDSGALKKTIKVRGKDTEVRVRIVHAEMTTADTREKLIDAYKDAAKTADIVYYSGHAGTSLGYSGVAVAYKPSRVALPASEFKNLDVPDRYQVFVFDGCETYTGYADKFYENPKKNPENADVVTVVNFSATQEKPNQAYGFLRSVLAEKGGGWVPRSWDSILEKVNEAADTSWVHVYGVHGIDDNPKLSPLADTSKFGAVCAKDADCGSVDSYCLTVAEGEGGKRCGLACADTKGCPGEARCSFLQGYPSSDDRQCIPTAR
ncbi:MAG: hypothetical protein U0169_24455 [Polyangiaceae bacterium]